MKYAQFALFAALSLLSASAHAFEVGPLLKCEGSGFSLVFSEIKGVSKKFNVAVSRGLISESFVIDQQNMGADTWYLDSATHGDSFKLDVTGVWVDGFGEPGHFSSSLNINNDKFGSQFVIMTCKNITQAL